MNIFTKLLKALGISGSIEYSKDGVTNVSQSPGPSQHRDPVLRTVKARVQELPANCSVTARMFPEFSQASVAKALKRLHTQGVLYKSNDKAKNGLTIYTTSGATTDVRTERVENFVDIAPAVR